MKPKSLLVFEVPKSEISEKLDKNWRILDLGPTNGDNSLDVMPPWSGSEMAYSSCILGNFFETL